MTGAEAAVWLEQYAMVLHRAPEQPDEGPGDLCMIAARRGLFLSTPGTPLNHLLWALRFQRPEYVRRYAIWLREVARTSLRGTSPYVGFIK